MDDERWRAGATTSIGLDMRSALHVDMRLVWLNQCWHLCHVPCTMYHVPCSVWLTLVRRDAAGGSRSVARDVP
jgi:hypothetical protein